MGVPRRAALAGLGQDRAQDSTPISSTTITKVTGTDVCRKMLATQPACATVTAVRR